MTMLTPRLVSTLLIALASSSTLGCSGEPALPEPAPASALGQRPPAQGIEPREVLAGPLWAPVASMNGLRWRHTAILLGSGKVLVAGGPLASAELYMPALRFT